eukprot:gene6560-2627_t
MHRCGARKCANCGVMITDRERDFTHQCKWREKGAPAAQRRRTRAKWAWDCESAMAKETTTLPDGSVMKRYWHRVYFVVVAPVDSNEEAVSSKMISFYNKDGYSALDGAFDFMRSQPPAIFISHNGRGYDTFLLYERLKERKIFTCAVGGAHPEKIIRVGQKLLQFEFGGQRFADSAAHLPAPLEQLPRMWDLPVAVAKGFC